MNLQELLGEAYNENMSIEDINNALQGKNLADLSTGNYVDINKYNREIQDLQAKLSTKESEIQKVNTNANHESSENQALINQLQEQLKALELESNKSNAIASMSEAKAKNAYEKGKQDGLKNGLGDMGKQKGSSSNGAKKENFGKELAQKMNANVSTVDYFKRN